LWVAVTSWVTVFLGTCREVATLKQQQRNPLDYLTAACEAALRDEAAPSLLPADVAACQRAAA